MTEASSGDLVQVPADRVAAAVLAVPGVTALHAGSLGEVGTYLPGRRVAGIRLGAEETEVHIAVAMGSEVRSVADAVLTAVRPLVSTPVQVVVEDVTAPVSDPGSGGA